MATTLRGTITVDADQAITGPCCGRCSSRCPRVSGCRCPSTTRPTGLNTWPEGLNQNATITVLADTEDATAKFGELQDQLDRLRNETADIAVKVNDSDADASLDDLRVRPAQTRSAIGGHQGPGGHIHRQRRPGEASSRYRPSHGVVWTAQGFDGAFSEIHRFGTGGWRGPLGHPVEGFRPGPRARGTPSPAEAAG